MATSIFARIGTIKGESRDARHKDEIEVLAWAWGLSQSGTAGSGGGAGAGAGAGKVTFQDLTFTHHIDRASPLLMRACATGEHLKDAVVTVRKAGKGQQEYLVITMNDILVTRVESSVSADGDSTLESVGLTFGKVDLEYKPQKADGSLDAGVHFTYDAKVGKAG